VVQNLPEPPRRLLERWQISRRRKTTSKAANAHSNKVIQQLGVESSVANRYDTYSTD